VAQVLTSSAARTAKPELNQQDVCVMSPFRKNVVLIRRRLRNLHFYNVDVRPCDEFQGLEKRLVVLCTTRSRRELADRDRAAGRGLFGQPNRLTVCQTRARQGLVVIGNPDLLVQDPDWVPYLQYYKRNGLVRGGTVHLAMVPDGGTLSELERNLV